MSAYSLFEYGKSVCEHKSLDVDTVSLVKIENFASYLENFKTNFSNLWEYKIDDLIEFFDKLALLWQEKNHPIKRYNSLGLSFLINWLKENNLNQISDISLKSQRKYLDDFKSTSDNSKILLKAQSKGLVCHWIAGNVPILGFISLVQGILTKNLNIVRVSKTFGSILPYMLDTFNEIEFRNKEGILISGSNIAKTICVLYYDKKDKSVGEILSLNSDVRVVCGGKEAVESIIGLKKRIDTYDIVFGPKYSFAVIDKTFLENSKSSKLISQKLAFDISSFDQNGCNSPHTLFVENSDTSIVESFCENLGKSLAEVLRVIPKENLQAGITTKILEARAKYGFSGRVISSDGTDWTVLYSESEKGMANPCYGRTIFVRRVDNIADVLAYVSKDHQTVGLAVHQSLKNKFSEELTQRGILRCPDLGSMSLYEVPWDGIFPMERMIKWVYFYA